MKTLKDIMNGLTAERREKIEARAEELIAEEMTLRDLRKAQDLTQERMAELLGVGQDNISRLESRTDMLLSTLRSYVTQAGKEIIGRIHVLDKNNQNSLYSQNQHPS